MGVKIAVSVITFLISVSAFIISGFQFMQKGFLLNNSYIFASEKEREAMDKKFYYRQSGIVFLLIGFIFLLNAAGIFFEKYIFTYISIGLSAVTIVYAAVSSVKEGIGKKRK